MQAQTREVLEARLAAAKLRRAKRKAREAMDAGTRGGGGGKDGGGSNSRASSAASVISSAHPSPAKQAGSGRCAMVQRGHWCRLDIQVRGSGLQTTATVQGAVHRPAGICAWEAEGLLVGQEVVGPTNARRFITVRSGCRALLLLAAVAQPAVQGHGELLAGSRATCRDLGSMPLEDLRDFMTPCRGPPSLRSTQEVQSPTAAGLMWLPAPHAGAGPPSSYMHAGRQDQQPIDPMAVEDALNNRAWPFLQDAPPQPQQMVYDHAHEAANNVAMTSDIGDGQDPANGGWLLGLRSFLPMAPYGAGAAAPPAGGLSSLPGGGTGNAPASQAAQGAAPIQWLPSGDQPMHSPTEGTAWSHGDSALMATDSPPRPVEQNLNWGSHLGAALVGNGAAASTLSRSPTGRGPQYGRSRAHAAVPEGPPSQPDADAEARGGSGGDGSLVSSATAMQDIRPSPVLRALDGWGGTTGRDHLAPPAVQGASVNGMSNGGISSKYEVQAARCIALTCTQITPVEPLVSARRSLMAACPAARRAGRW